MTQPTSGLLPALIGYYHRLADDPDETWPNSGSSVEKIHFRVVLEPDGIAVRLQGHPRAQRRGKPFPSRCSSPTAAAVPASGSSRSSAGTTRATRWAATTKASPTGRPTCSPRFATFTCRSATSWRVTRDSRPLPVPGAWEPARAEQLPNWEEAAGLNVVFKLRAREGYVHQSEAVRSAWLRS